MVYFYVRILQSGFDGRSLLGELTVLLQPSSCIKAGGEGWGEMGKARKGRARTPDIWSVLMPLSHCLWTAIVVSYLRHEEAGSLPSKPALDSILRFAQIRWEVWTHSGGRGEWETSTVKIESDLCGYFLKIWLQTWRNMRNKSVQYELTTVKCKICRSFSPQDSPLGLHSWTWWGLPCPQTHSTLSPPLPLVSVSCVYTVGHADFCPYLQQLLTNFF